MNRIVALVLVIAIVALAGCAKPAETSVDSQLAPVSTEETVIVVQDDLAAIDALTDDLDFSEIDSLDADLASLG